MKTFKESFEDNLIAKEDLKGYDYLDFASKEELAKLAYNFIQSSRFKEQGAFVVVEELIRPKFTTKYYRIFFPRTRNWGRRRVFSKELAKYIEGFKVKNFDPYEGWFTWMDAENIYHPLVKRNTIIKRFDPTEDYKIKDKTKEEFGDIIGSL